MINLHVCYTGLHSDENNLDNSAITSIKKKIEEFNIETEGYKIVIYPIFTKLLGFINDINNDNKQENEMIVDVMIYILYASLEMETNRTSLSIDAIAEPNIRKQCARI